MTYLRVRSILVCHRTRLFRAAKNSTGAAMNLTIPDTIPRTALVTGAGRRLGRAMAEALGAAGFAVAVHCNTSVDEAEVVAAGRRRCR